MNLSHTIDLFCYGTSEGAVKAWDTRGRRTRTPEERMSNKISDSEKSDPVFMKTLQRLNNDPTLTKYEQDNVVALARAYTDAAHELKNGNSTEVHAGPVGGYTQERADWHSQVLAAYESKFGPPQEHPVAIITGGLAGSGKSTGLKDVPGVNKFVHINNDDIKEAAPEYNGANAAYLHKESDEVSRAVLELATQARQNIVVDATMRSPGDSSKGFYDSLAGKIQELHDRGYEVHLMFMNVNMDQSIERSMQRYGATGRFVPPDHIKSSVSSQGNESVNIDNFRRASQRPEVSGWKLYDNKGTKAKLIERGGKDIDV